LILSLEVTGFRIFIAFFLANTS